MHLPPLSVTAAHQLLIHHTAPAALDSISVVEAPAAAELAAPRGVRDRSAAAVTQPHRDPSPRGVRTAGLICEDKDGKSAGRRAGFIQAERGETRLSAGQMKLAELTRPDTNVVSSAAPVLGQSWEKFSAAAHRIGGISQTQVSALTAVVVRLLPVQQSAAANLVGLIQLPRYDKHTP